jgi:hypothetical protein
MRGWLWTRDDAVNCHCAMSLAVRLCDHIVTSWTVDLTDVSTVHEMRSHLIRESLQSLEAALDLSLFVRARLENVLGQKL